MHIDHFYISFKTTAIFLGLIVAVPNCLENITVVVLFHKQMSSNCRLILMVTQTTENGRQKCARYWPATPEVVSPYNEVTLELESELDESDGIIERTLVFKTKGKIERRVRQIQFIDWPDHGVPHDPSHFLQLCGQHFFLHFKI